MAGVQAVLNPPEGQPDARAGLITRSIRRAVHGGGSTREPHFRAGAIA